jgi:hypothetical protein
MDILPCVREEQTVIDKIIAESVKPEYADCAIAITDKDPDTKIYDWSSGNASGYANWFRDVNAPYLAAHADAQRRLLVLNEHFASIEDVPEPLLKSPLQRVIQLLKRHRDFRFSNKANESNKPISIIITTLAARIAQNKAIHNASIAELLSVVVGELARRAVLLEEGYLRHALHMEPLFTRDESEWKIPNPVNPFENFAERWGENDNAKAKAFFQWVAWLGEDLLFESRKPGMVFNSLKESFGTDIIADLYRAKKLNPIEAPNVIISTQDAPKPYRM